MSNCGMMLYQQQHHEDHSTSASGIDAYNTAAVRRRGRPGNFRAASHRSPTPTLFITIAVAIAIDIIIVTTIISIISIISVIIIGTIIDIIMNITSSISTKYYLFILDI